MRTGYLAKEGQEKELENELQGITQRYDKLFIAPSQNAYWAQNVWYAPEEISFTSISDAANKLKERQKLWSHTPFQNVRRAHLIQEKLAYFAPKPLPFLGDIPKAPIGSWMLLDANTLLASPHCKSPFAAGVVQFQESPIPPSRAYLKLWEFFTCTGIKPKAGDRCLELGACPGSWTWVLQGLGAKVTAVDRAPLDPAIAALPNITFLKKDAFAIKPEEFPGLNWIFSDLICTPEKLYTWITPWIEANPSLNFVCTLKFQGAADPEIIKKFANIKESNICHLYHNKHELTWWLTKKLS